MDTDNDKKGEAIAIQAVAWISLGSGLSVFAFLQETRHKFGSSIGVVKS